ncbi:SH3 domain-containing protein [Roseovarius sp. A21]|uniref:SH3 domain-containing protein n=1 Tax=Roseovarius bejariae TaxID=2576383 RepID=A0A844CHC5_9RHOB|nr:SH3 domain-containing protein [Roseovarius bejariae]MRU14711.1 SH3 domain-containing protein [Roseovarius bejariae]
MWRFILISFAFLGWSFYELSGGADYAPVTNSIQVRAQLDNARPKARPVKVDVTRVAANGDRAEEETVTRSITSLADLDLSGGQRFEISLASVESPAPEKAPIAKVNKAVATGGAKDTPLPDHVAKAVAAASLSGVASQSVDQAALATAPDTETVQPPRDIRRVTGTVVNMRSGPGTTYGRTGKLYKDDKVIVLRDPGNGWIKLRNAETGRVGWMADWLVTAAN